MKCKVDSVWILLFSLFKIMKPVNLQFGMPMYAPLMLPPPPPIFTQQSPMMIMDKKKPPCPPCLCKPACTPAFFSYCSPCHKMCRCRDGIDSVPIPLPPIGAPQVPASPILSHRKPRKKLPFVYSSEESTDSSSLSEYYKYRRHRKNRHRHSKYL
ncbi:unnamed protein product [Euphydryas editha]|uniref:Uncharacterized protein n=1 Tax=Euphydryas editha TaxID=104508 RepID=A0AAU9TK85_EUPED|nr:unnamed protein product [Euphydryas editha]